LLPNARLDDRWKTDTSKSGIDGATLLGSYAEVALSQLLHCLKLACRYVVHRGDVEWGYPQSA
jgi:hypothetical protein